MKYFSDIAGTILCILVVIFGYQVLRLNMRLDTQDKVLATMEEHVELVEQRIKNMESGWNGLNDQVTDLREDLTIRGQVGLTREQLDTVLRGHLVEVEKRLRETDEAMRATLLRPVELRVYNMENPTAEPVTPLLPGAPKQAQQQ